MKPMTVCLIYSWMIQLWSVILCILLATVWSAADTNTPLHAATTSLYVPTTNTTKVDYTISVRSAESKCSFTQLPSDGGSVVWSMVALIANDSNALWRRDCELLCCWAAQCRLSVLTDKTCLLLSCRSRSMGQCVRVQRPGYNTPTFFTPVYPSRFPHSFNLSNSSDATDALSAISNESRSATLATSLCSKSTRQHNSTNPHSFPPSPPSSAAWKLSSNPNEFIDKCGVDQTCVPLFWRHNVRAVGLCRCVGPLKVRDPVSGQCIDVDPYFGAQRLDPARLWPLNVSVSNLSYVAPLSGSPLGVTSLRAEVVNADIENTTLQYLWSPLLPSSSASTANSAGLELLTASGWNQPSLRLSGLAVGVHRYIVEVFGPRHYGNAIASVTVQNGKTNSTNPVAVITPNQKTFRLTRNHTASIILDGSQSYSVLPANSAVDNTSTASQLEFSWFLDTSPADYQLSGNSELLTAGELQLNRLVAGNYSVRLTVTTDDGESDSTVANFTVLSLLSDTKSSDSDEVDSQATISSNDDGDDGVTINSDENSPKATTTSNDDDGEVGVTHQAIISSNSNDDDDGDRDGAMKQLHANAGPDITLYLPNTNITLNGSTSASDNRAISYQWTRGANTLNKSLLMEAGENGLLYLSLSQLGVYTFVLHVADETGTTDSDSVDVEVKFRPLKVTSGSPVNVTLPRSWAVLEATGNTDSPDPLRWQWHQISGPSQTTILNSNQSRVNVTGLTEGHYLFGVTAGSDLTNGSSEVIVNVNQAVNERPLVDAGGNLTVQLPVTVVTLNGSRSRDDSAVIDWRWSRDMASPAAGDVIGGSDNSAVLQLVNLVAGCYRFTLTATDRAGLKGHDTVQVTVLPDPNIRSRVSIELDVNFYQIQFSDRQLFLQRLSQLLTAKNSCSQLKNSSVHVQLLSWSPAQLSERLLVELRAACVSTLDGEPIIYIPAETIVHQIQTIVHNKTQSWSSSQSTSPSAPPLVYVVNRVFTSVCLNRCSDRGECVPETRVCRCRTFWLENPVRVYFGDGQRNCDWSLLYVVIIGFSCLSALSFSCWLLAVVVRRHVNCWRSCLPLCSSRDPLLAAGSSSSFKPGYRPLQHPSGSVQMVNKVRYSSDAGSNSRLISRHHASNTYSSSSSVASSGSDNDSEPLFESAVGQKIQYQQQQKPNRRANKTPHVPNICHKRRLRLNGTGTNKQV